MRWLEESSRAVSDWTRLFFIFEKIQVLPIFTMSCFLANNRGIS